MENYEIKWSTEIDVEEIVKLSKEFEIENCCNGIIADDKDYFLSKKVAVAKYQNRVVGYCYGKFEVKEKNCSMYKAGCKSYYIQEIFVEKRHRNKNVGQMLFNFVENYAKENYCDVIEITAVSKNYKKLLSFYIEKLNMNFWSATLIKDIKSE